MPRGTGFVIAEVIVWMLVAGIIGLVAGWFLSRFGADSKARTEADALVAAERSRVHGLETSLSAAKSRVDDLEKTIESLGGDKSELSAQVAALTSELGEKTDEGDAAAANAAALMADLESARDRLAELEAAVAAKTEEGDAASARVSALETEVETLRASAGDADRTARLLGEAQDRAGGLERELADVRRRFDECRDGLERARGAADVTEPPAASPDDLPDRDTAVRRVAEIAERTRGAGPAVEDDLKLIHGVGPKLERLLKSMGITSFAQVARFESGDIAYVTAALEAFPGRIERDDWMSSAAEEHRKKYGSSPA